MGERAISVTSGYDVDAQNVVDSLALAGVAAAISDRGCNVVAANDWFAAQMGRRLISGLSGFRFADREFDARFRRAIDRQRAGGGAVESIALRGAAGSAPLAIHLISMIKARTALVPCDWTLLLSAGFARTSTPSTDLLRLLFALTPAEARVATHLVDGGSIADAVEKLGIGKGTVRSHLKNVFAKTGVGRQSDLVRLVMSFAPPAISSQIETKLTPPPNGGGESRRINSS